MTKCSRNISARHDFRGQLRSCFSGKARGENHEIRSRVGAPSTRVTKPIIVTLSRRRRFATFFIDTDKAGSKLTISDKDLKEEYDRLQPEFKQAGVKVQQILLKVARKDLDAQVEQKAKDLIVKLRGTSGQSTEAAFAEAARGNSEDPATAKNGGFLSRPVKKNPNKPDALYERAVDMQPGDVSDVPIKYAGNWYILRRGDAVPKTFEEAKPELLVSLRNRRGYTAAFQLARKAETRLKKPRTRKRWPRSWLPKPI